MIAARRHRSFGTVTGWWATATRVLAFVLALAVAAPATGFAEDVAFHQGHQGHDDTALVMSADASPGGTHAADPGLSCHLHCGCHVVAHLAGTDPTPLIEGSRPCYTLASETVSSIFPDRLPRPPRA